MIPTIERGVTAIKLEVSEAELKMIRKAVEDVALGRSHRLVIGIQGRLWKQLSSELSQVVRSLQE